MDINSSTHIRQEGAPRGGGCLTFAGCFGAGPASPTASSPASGGVDTATSHSPTEVPSLPLGLHQGRGESISTNATGTPDEVRYFPGNDTIRYVAGWVHTNHEEVAEDGAPPVREPTYEYTAFDEWADTHAADLGAAAVRTEIPRRVTAPNPDVSVGFGTRSDDLLVLVKRATLEDREGNVVGQSNVSSARLVAVTPKNVTVALQVEDRSYVRTYPVRVENVTYRYS